MKIIFANFTDLMNSMADEATTLFARITDKKLFRRIVYASFLIARANGVFKAVEKTALSKLIAKDFPHFKLTDIIEMIEEAQTKINFDAVLGEQEILAEVAKATGDDKSLIIRTICYIAASDDDFDNNEKAVARKVCATLNESPALYGL